MKKIMIAFALVFLMVLIFIAPAQATYIEALPSENGYCSQQKDGSDILGHSDSTGLCRNVEAYQGWMIDTILSYMHQAILAFPDPGYKFSHWEVDWYVHRPSTLLNNPLYVHVCREVKFKPVFVLIPIPEPEPVDIVEDITERVTVRKQHLVIKTKGLELPAPDGLIQIVFPGLGIDGGDYIYEGDF